MRHLNGIFDERRFFSSAGNPAFSRAVAVARGRRTLSRELRSSEAIPIVEENWEAAIRPAVLRYEQFGTHFRVEKKATTTENEAPWWCMGETDSGGAASISLRMTDKAGCGPGFFKSIFRGEKGDEQSKKIYGLLCLLAGNGVGGWTKNGPCADLG